MAKLLDLTGDRYGTLTVVKEADRVRKTVRRWEVVCDCGNTTIVAQSHLRDGHTKSCGKCQPRPVKHGLRHHPIYNIYYGAKSRCTDKNNTHWKYYGGRGIKFLFSSFEEFAEEVLDSWSEGLAIDRINTNGHYEKGNVRWVTPAEQNANKRSNIWITHEGKTMIAADWAKELGFTTAGFSRRLKQYGIPRAITEPHRYSNFKRKAAGVDCGCFCGWQRWD